LLEPTLFCVLCVYDNINYTWVKGHISASADKLFGQPTSNGGYQKAVYILIMEVVRKTIKRKWVFYKTVALFRINKISYFHLINFLNDPEKELKESIKNQGQTSLYPT
jgi:hypothetical protein